MDERTHKTAVQNSGFHGGTFHIHDRKSVPSDAGDRTLEFGSCIGCDGCANAGCSGCSGCGNSDDELN